MSLEAGGRADKYGNKYENFALATYLIQLVNERINSITVEPLGETADFVEFIIEYPDSKIRHCQCKASNGAQTSWRICDLAKYDVFYRAQKIVLSNSNNLYTFISPLPYGELNELCKRAQTNSSFDDFYRYQIKDHPIRKTFEACVKQFKYHEDNPAEMCEMLQVLSRCEFISLPDNSAQEDLIEQLIGSVFTGPSEAAKTLLENYAIAENHFGKKIIESDIVKYMEKQGFNIRDKKCSAATVCQINSLNEEFEEIYEPINNKLIPRKSSNKIIENILKGKFIVLKGKAGNGKSGCLQEVIDYLKEKNIPYLALKLNKYIPSGTDDNFGKQLGLSESPVKSIAKLASGRRCVLILDQLDSLRWTSSSSAKALDICKAMIKDATFINKENGGNISIIFSVRSFDIETDKGLQKIFETPAEKDLSWENITIDVFTDNTVKKIVGENYALLSPKLKELLKTPASLYIWSMLDDSKKNNNISTFNELMDSWWEQILLKGEDQGLTSETTDKCIMAVVSALKNADAAVVPINIFHQNMKYVNFISSNGLLKINRSQISFVHQSFYDYFLTKDILQKIYSGISLAKQIEELDSQTPAWRYRVIYVLQYLIDIDQSQFIKQSREIIKNNTIRYYFKCCIFEIISQCKNPQKNLLEFLKEYHNQKDWRLFIEETVLPNNPIYIKELYTFTAENIFSKFSCSLLKSILDIDPIYVVETVKPYANQNKDNNNKILWILRKIGTCIDNNIHELKVSLLSYSPDSLIYYYDLHELTEQVSPKAIDILSIIINNWNSQKDKEDDLRDIEIFNDFIYANYSEITSRLFTEIDETTKSFMPQWPSNNFFPDFTDWTDFSYKETGIRKIINLVKKAFIKLIQANPGILSKVINSLKYPASAITHEIVMEGFCCLTNQYSDEIVKWLLNDFNNKIFVYSNHTDDYLFYTKQLIKRFSPYCNAVLFKELENIICTWTEPTSYMIDIFKLRKRFEYNAKHDPLYYQYWGGLQKELLPLMDQSRLSEKAKQLLQTLNRNEWIRIPHFCFGMSIGEASTVVSPVENKLDYLSNKNWLQIITSNKSGKESYFKSPNNDGFSYETTPRFFASSFGKAVIKNPSRFISFSLENASILPAIYITNLFNALSDNNCIEVIDEQTLSKAILTFKNINDSESLKAIIRLIEKYPEYHWCLDVLNFLCESAINNPDPGPNEYSIKNANEELNNTIDLFLTNALNSVRGCALSAISKLLWKSNEYGDIFKSTIKKSIDDTNTAVLFASIECLLAFYSIDRDFSENLFDKLLVKEPRIIGYQRSWYILRNIYAKDRPKYNALMMTLSESDDKELSSVAAHFISMFAIYFNDSDSFKYIKEHCFNERQQDKICRKAIFSFDTIDRHDICEQILLHFIDASSNEINAFLTLFTEERININRDSKFLIQLMSSKQGPHLLHFFLEFLNTSNDSIISYLPILAAIGNNIKSVISNDFGQYYINDFLQCVIKILERSNDNKDNSDICLDIIDNLYRDDLLSHRSLSSLIHNNDF